MAKKVFDPSNFEVVHRGPTWERGADGAFILPERTLGYECLKFAFKYLQQNGKPWKATPEQARFILWFYALDERGVFVHRHATLRRLKGWRSRPTS